MEKPYKLTETERLRAELLLTQEKMLALETAQRKQVLQAARGELELMLSKSSGFDLSGSDYELDVNIWELRRKAAVHPPTEIRANQQGLSRKRA
jgi:hypothetical protein